MFSWILDQIAIETMPEALDGQHVIFSSLKLAPKLCNRDIHPQYRH